MAHVAVASCMSLQVQLRRQQLLQSSSHELAVGPGPEGWKWRASAGRPWWKLGCPDPERTRGFCAARAALREGGA